MIQDTAHSRIIRLLREETVLNPDHQQELLKLGTEVIDVLIKALGGTHPRQLVNAMSTLEQIGASKACKAVPALLALQTHPHTWVRMSSAKAIGILGREGDVDPLLDWLNTESEVLVQIWIVVSLGRLGSVSAVEPLMTALQRTDSSTLRYTIIRALGQLGDPRPISLITQYLNDPDRHVQKDAQEAISKLNGYAEGE